jgi:hypothetical protein
MTSINRHDPATTEQVLGYLDQLHQMQHGLNQLPGNWPKGFRPQGDTHEQPFWWVTRAMVALLTELLGSEQAAESVYEAVWGNDITIAKAVELHQIHELLKPLPDLEPSAEWYADALTSTRPDVDTLGPAEDEPYAFLDDDAERAWLTNVDPAAVLANAHRAYEFMAEGGLSADSFIRELAFTKAADALGISYEVLYQAWILAEPIADASQLNTGEVL